MKFNIPEQTPPLLDNELLIGNVYKCKGGSKTDYWIVVGIDTKSVFLIGVNKEGVMTSATSYGRHVFDGSSPLFNRKSIGRCEGIEQLEFDINWSDE